MVILRRGPAQALAHGRGRRRDRPQARREDGPGHAGRAPRAAPLGRPVPGAPLGARGLPASLPAPGGRPPAVGRGRRPGAAHAHGRGPALRARARQERPDRRARGRPGCAARARPARRHARGAERELRLLVDHREDLVAERTRAVNRLRWHLLDLGIDEPVPARLTGRRCSRTSRRASPAAPSPRPGWPAISSPGCAT